MWRGWRWWWGGGGAGGRTGKQGMAGPFSLANYVVVLLFWSNFNKMLLESANY